jgi:hypothetical protein
MPSFVRIEESMPDSMPQPHASPDDTRVNNGASHGSNVSDPQRARSSASMGHSGNTPTDRGTAQPLRRTIERIILGVAGAYNILMASITVFIYTNWFRNNSYDILEEKGLLKQGVSDVSNVVYVAEIYGLIIAIIGVISIIVASRGMKPGTISRGVIIYLVVIIVFSLGTADWLGLIAYSLCLAVYVARNKAIHTSGTVRR